MPIVPGAYWDLLDRNTPPVKRRAMHAKARTGCLTCKRRRVKCDETKPTCARCIKSGHMCAGYEDCVTAQSSNSNSNSNSKCTDSSRSKHLDKPTPAQLLLRPKPAVEVRGSGSGDAEYRVNLVRASLTPNYLDVRDALYFERFKCQMLVDIGAWCGAEYWRHKILREILLDKTVQHAALGAAAMLMDLEQQSAYVRSQRMSGKRSLRSAPMAAAIETGEEESLAINESTTETTSMIEHAREEKPLPVVPFSNISPHGKAALHHYTVSIGLCRQTLAAEGVTSSTARSSLTATFFFAVFELVQGNVAEADRILSNGVSLLDDALSQLNADGNPALVADDELHEIQLAFDRMRVTWGLCPYFGGQKGSSAKAAKGTRHFELPALDAPVRTKQVFWNAFSSDFGQFMMSVQQLGNDQVKSLPAILAQRTNYLVQLRYWLPILEDLCAQDPSSAILCTTKVYAQTSIIFLNCFLDRSELAYDTYLPIFKDIVSTYERLLPAQPHARQQQGHLRLTLDVDLFHIITFTVSKCRDRETRAHALRVFGQMTRRQALWTNSGMLAALWALADLEDKGRDAHGILPASSRYRYVNSEWDFQKRQMMAVFVPVLSAPMQTGDMFTVRIPINF
ncbi:hypothetical protein E0Z10_g5276 [Xylaria hypoxylon]|uniref:Zn(2)-C6 fungal-type domain-containing protein n=1 Tax=Xylaria hypoxylon TaxID=37992 RepID=A0A4Z0YWD5_9PEZI|nr:hypothetical protein E0Z10_g5276 [Xylaria hypoxylon]